MPILKPRASPCTFSQHATCAAEMVDHFEWSDREKCPIACETEQFARTSTEVTTDGN